MDYQELMGLLDDPEQKRMAQAQGLLGAGIGILANNTNRKNPWQAIQAGGMQGMGMYQDAMKQSRADAMQKIQMSELADKMKQKQAKDQATAEFLKNPNIPDNLRQAIAAGLVDIGDLMKPQKLGEGDALVNPWDKITGGKGTMLQMPPKAVTPPSAVQEYQFAQIQGFKGTFDEWDKERRRAGASSVVVQPDKDPFKNTMTMRQEFNQLPEAKAYAEVNNAYRQIQFALSSPSATNDLAAATKIMKMLDPGSVVRESELGMAMAATGLVDRIANYKNMLETGQKLTPSQRADFQKTADGLYQAAASTYNQKATEYRDRATRYNLNPNDVATPAKVRTYNPATGKIE